MCVCISTVEIGAGTPAVMHRFPLSVEFPHAHSKFFPNQEVVPLIRARIIAGEELKP